MNSVNFLQNLLLIPYMLKKLKILIILKYIKNIVNKKMSWWQGNGK